MSGLVSISDVNLAFSYAARNLLLEDERLLKHFKFTIENTGHVNEYCS